MKKWLLLPLLFLVSLSVFAQKTQLIGTLKNPDGSLANGYLFFSITQQASVSSQNGCGGPALVMPNTPIRIQVVNGVMVNPPNIYGSDCTLPAGIPYNMSIKNNAGQLLSSILVTPQGTTQDVGALVSVDNVPPNKNFSISYTDICLISQGCGGGGSIGDSDVVNQTASQGTVNLVGTVPASGKYRISYYADQNALCSTGSNSVLFTFSWIDSTNTRTANSISLTLGSAQSVASGSIQGVVPVFALSGTAIIYTSTVIGSCTTGTSSYDAHISVESVK